MAAGRKKREARQGKQLTGTGYTPVDLSVANNNLKNNVVLNIKNIIGATTIENYYYYDVSPYFFGDSIFKVYFTGIHDRAKLSGKHKVDHQHEPYEDF